MRILYIDRWAKKAVTLRFAPLASLDALGETDTSTLLHFGSLFDREQERVSEATLRVGRLRVRDIRSFPRQANLASDILAAEQPDVIVIMDQINNPIYQAFIAAAQVAGIPVGIMQYGCYPAYHEEQKSAPDVQTSRAWGWRSVGYNVWAIVYLFRSLLRIGSWTHAVRYSVDLLGALLRYRSAFFMKPLPGLVKRPTFTLVFSEWYKQYDALRSGLPAQHIHVVGNPFIPAAEAAPLASQPVAAGEERQALFILQPFVEDLFITSQAWFTQQLKRICTALQQHGYPKVVLRLHPRSDGTLLQTVAQMPGVELAEGGDLDEMIQRAQVVVGVSSTALINAVLQRKPTLLAAWLEPITFSGSGFAAHEVFTTCTTWAEFLTVLKEGREKRIIEAARVDTFIQDYIGPHRGRAALSQALRVIQMYAESRGASPLNSNTDKAGSRKQMDLTLPGEPCRNQ